MRLFLHQDVNKPKFRLKVLNDLANNMDDLKINTDITGAKEELQDDNNFISEKDSGVHKPKDCQTSFQKNSSLTRSEELSEDQSEQALSGGQSALFLPASTPAVPTENFPLPTGAVVNGPVSCSSSTKTSNMNEAIEKSETTSEHTCQLCGGWFDTKIGLSNHVRGHLKRLGKTKWDAHKSPICVLNEMMQNEEKYEKILKALNSRRIIPRPFVAQKLSSGDDFLSHNVLPLDEYHNGLKTEALSVSASEEEGLHFLSECGERKPELPSGRKNQSLTLIELLKSRRLGEERNSAVSPHKTHNQTARKRFVQKCVLPLNEDSPLIYQPQKMDLTVHSAIDCKQKKSRSRSGSKKKMLTLPHGADEVYILRCRFCGLVFRGPLSVQEDWIKHLQRHIVNANLPRTGAGMVEVTSLLKKPASITETSFSLLMAEAAS